jgi:dipeptidyl aminopeptidase/acylaminoacyl peptidase
MMSTGNMRLLKSSDILNLVTICSPMVCPSGILVAYIRQAADIVSDQFRKRLHVYNTITGNDCFVESAGDVVAICWAHSTRLVVVSVEGEGSVVSFWNAADGSVAKLRKLESIPGFIGASHDGTLIAMIMNVQEERYAIKLPGMPEGADWGARARFIDRTVWRVDGVGEVDGYAQIFTMDLESGGLTRLTHGVTPSGLFPSGLSWSADDQKIFFSSNLREDWESQQFNTEIYAIDVNSANVTTLTDRWGPDFDPKVSPDGKWIAYRGFDDHCKRFSGITALYLMRCDGTEKRRLSDVKNAIGSHGWDWKGEGLYFSYVQDGRQQLAWTDVRGEWRLVAKNLAQAGGFDVEPTLIGSVEMSACPMGLVTVVAGADNPGNLVMIDDGGKVREWCSPNQAWLESVQLGSVEQLNYFSTDGTPLQAWVTYPPLYDPTRAYPLILDIHGGPDLAYGPQFSFRFQLYAANEYIVVAPNYRGSAGTDMSVYDRPWDFPGLEHEDLLTTVDAVIAAASIDPERLFVTGLSAGGILTAWLIGKTKRFAAAAVQSPIINFISHSLTQDLYSSYLEREFQEMPWENPMAYWKKSPLSLVANIETPTLIIQGEKDSRTPSCEGIQLYQALRLRKVESAILLLPDAFHIPTRPMQLLEEQQYIIDWFNRYS